MQPPRPYPAAHLRQFVRANSRQKPGESNSASPIESLPGPELVTQERERYLFMCSAPSTVFAIDQTGLVRVKFQPHLGQPTGDRVPHEAGLAFAAAVDHHVIAVTLESDSGELPFHPHVERVVHEEIR